MTSEQAMEHVASIGVTDIGGPYTSDDYHAHKALARIVREQDGEIARLEQNSGGGGKIFCIEGPMNEGSVYRHTENPRDVKAATWTENASGWSVMPSTDTVTVTKKSNGRN